MGQWAENVYLRHVSKQPSRVRLREPRGDDEFALAGVDTREAIELLARLLGVGPEQVAGLSASDRDSLLAALYRGLWGDNIVASRQCSECGSSYDLQFELSALQRSLWERSAPSVTSALRDVISSDQQRWHLPAVADEEAAAQLGMQAGRAHLAQVCADDHSELSVDDVAQRLEAIAPIIDVDLDAPCPECRASQQARFDIQTFALQRLLDERNALVSDIHTLALGYGWSLTDILGLSRSVRRSLVERLGNAAPRFG